MKTKLTENLRRHVGESLTIRWGTSRGRDSYGYTTCSLRNQRGQRVAACNGGGYDMQGTVIGNWLAATFSKELCAIKDGRSFYGLSFHDPNFNPGKAVIGKDCSDRTFSGKSDGKTVEQAEKDGDTVGLERYQAFYSASSKVPTAKHVIPLIDGACGVESVFKILNAIGLALEKVHSSSKLDIYVIREHSPQ